MINNSDFNFELVHQLGYIDGYSRSDVALIYAEKINSGNFMKYDAMMIKHYGVDGEKYLKLVLMFNNCNDLTEINIGDILYIPDLGSLLSVLEVIDETIPGIVEFMDMSLSEELTTVDPNIVKQPKDRRKLTAVPKLKITKEMPKFTITEDKGIIEY